MINIILDKSAFQSLSYLEQLKLNDYYRHNITPIITQEILGDLKKESKEGKPPSTDRVIDFAKKLFPHQAIVNAHYEQIIRSELIGQPIGMDGRPFLTAEKVVEAAHQKKGMIIAETDEEKSIQKWRNGLFEEADYELSKLWREFTTQKDRLENVKKALPKIESDKKIKSFETLKSHVDKILDTYESQDTLLKDILTLYDIRANEAISCFANWLRSGRPKLINYIPYTLYCIRVDLIFNVGIQHDLITTRPTNKVDLEYIYYLPFCDVFSSGDKFHMNLAPLVLQQRQKFIEASELKNDLKGILEYLESLQESDRKQFYKEPPIEDSFLTYRLWKEYFKYPKGRPIDRNISEERLEKMKQEMKDLIEASEGEQVELNEGEEPEFIMKKRYLGRNDPCYCGSTKPLVGCCISEEKWKEIVDKQKK